MFMVDIFYFCCCLPQTFTLGDITFFPFVCFYVMINVHYPLIQSPTSLMCSVYFTFYKQLYFLCPCFSLNILPNMSLRDRILIMLKNMRAIFVNSYLYHIYWIKGLNS